MQTIVIRDLNRDSKFEYILQNASSAENLGPISDYIVQVISAPLPSAQGSGIVASEKHLMTLDDSSSQRRDIVIGITSERVKQGSVSKHANSWKDTDYVYISPTVNLAQQKKTRCMSTGRLQDKASVNLSNLSSTSISKRICSGSDTPDELYQYSLDFGIQPFWLTLDMMSAVKLKDLGTAIKSNLEHVERKTLAGSNSNVAKHNRWLRARFSKQTRINVKTSPGPITANGAAAAAASSCDEHHPDVSCSQTMERNQIMFKSFNLGPIRLKIEMNPRKELKSASSILGSINLVTSLLVPLQKLTLTFPSIHLRGLMTTSELGNRIAQQLLSKKNR